MKKYWVYYTVGGVEMGFTQEAENEEQAIAAALAYEPAALDINATEIEE